MSVRRLAAGAVAGLVLAGGALLAPAGAQEGEGRAVVRAVDATDPSAVRITFGWSGDPAAATDIDLSVGGSAVEAEAIPLAEQGLGSFVAIVVDTSASTAGGVLDAERAAVAEVLAGLPAGTEASLTLAGEGADTAVGRTSDLSRIDAALASVRSSGDGALLTGVREAAQRAAAAAEDDVPAAVLLVTDGVRGDRADAVAVRATLVEAGAPLYVLGVEGGPFDAAGFSDLATATGGRLVTAAATGELVASGRDLVGDLGGLYSTVVDGSDAGDLVALELGVGGATASATYITGSDLVGPARLAPQAVPEPSTPSLLRSDAVKWVAITLIAAAVVAVIAVLGAGAVKRDDGLSGMLQAYEPRRDGEAEEEEGQGFATTALVQRAVAATEALATKRGLLIKVEQRLERADIPLRAGEALFFWAAGVAVLFVGATVALGDPLMGLGVGVLAALLPAAVVNNLAERKRKAFEAELPDMLQLLSSTMRAGYSLMQGVEAVSTEAPDPIGKELRKVVTEARLGRPLEEALEAVADRMESADFAWAVMAIRIQREVGGNLSELLLTVGETMTERERMRREVKTLTAEGKMSAVVLGLLTPGIAIVMYGINSDYISTLFESSIGRILLVAGAMLAFGGFLWMNKLMKVEI